MPVLQGNEEQIAQGIKKAIMKVDSHKFANDDEKKIVKQIIRDFSNHLEENNEVACEEGVIRMKKIKESQ